MLPGHDVICAYRPYRPIGLFRQLNEQVFDTPV